MANAARMRYPKNATSVAARAPLTRLPPKKVVAATLAPARVTAVAIRSHP